MKITSDLKALQSAYMQAKTENNTPEMNRLKAKAMDVMRNQKTEKAEKPTEQNEESSIVMKNVDGDSLEISREGKLKTQNCDNACVSN